MAAAQIAILSPMYTEDERWVANAIRKELEHGKQQYRTYQPYTDGLERDLFELLSASAGPANASEAKRAILLSSAVNFYNIIQESAACVLVCDGRAPDEGSVFWAAVAFASGKPVLLYKSDYRTFISTADAPMVKILSLNYGPVKDIKTLNDHVESHFARYNAGKQKLIPPYNHLLQILGERVCTHYRSYSFASLLSEMEHDALVETLIPENTKEYPSRDIRDQSVYCSGSTLCAAASRELTAIAQFFFTRELRCYLPDQHRSGVSDLFAIDLHGFDECQHFVISLNGRIPDEGVVAEVGMAFARGRPTVIYRSDSRAFFGGAHGFLHPALQMAGHLDDPAAKYDQIYSKLVRQAGFMKSVEDYCKTLANPANRPT